MSDDQKKRYTNEYPVNSLEEWRDYFLAIINKSEYEEVKNLATFILSGVLIGDRIVISLVDLFNIGSPDSRALGDRAREERTILQDKLEELASYREKIEYLKLNSRGVEFSIYTLLNDENYSKLNCVAVSIATDPKSALILIGSNNKVDYVLRLYELENPVNFIRDLESMFMEASL